MPPVPQHVLGYWRTPRPGFARIRRTAADANEALLVLVDFRPRLSLMQLPGMDGLTLPRKALAAGCDGYITKPIDTRTLPRIIASCFAEQRPPS